MRIFRFLGLVNAALLLCTPMNSAEQFDRDAVIGHLNTIRRSRFGDVALEVIVRYPVEIRNESAMDEEVTRKVLELIQSAPDVQGAVSGSPKIRSAIRG